MDDRAQEQFKEWLLREKDRLITEISYVESTMQLPQSEWGGESQYENHLADLGTSTFARESDLSLARNSRDMLERINGALARIENGTYGLCVVCGRPIERERLEALPYVDLCMEDKRKEEKSW